LNNNDLGFLHPAFFKKQGALFFSGGSWRDFVPSVCFLKFGYVMTCVFFHIFRLLILFVSLIESFLCLAQSRLFVATEDHATLPPTDSAHHCCCMHFSHCCIRIFRLLILFVSLIESFLCLAQSRLFVATEDHATLPPTDSVHHCCCMHFSIAAFVFHSLRACQDCTYNIFSQCIV
jgi:hypothetical protein